MIKVFIQVENHRKYTIPVPYSFLQVGCSILSSKLLWRQLYKVTNKYAEKPLPILTIDPVLGKKQLKQLVREIKHYKGFELVDVTLQDGTKVKVNL